MISGKKVRKEHPGLAVGPMQKILSEMWKGLGEDEAARYAKVCCGRCWCYSSVGGLYFEGIRGGPWP